MKYLFMVGAFATASLAQTAQFTNTSFSSPYTIGQTVNLSWTVGNGLPITLSIINSTWNFPIFSGRAVLPTTYAWSVSAIPGFVSGNYQLALEQANAGVNNSPAFGVVVPNGPNSTNATATSSTMTAMPATATVTYIYFDHKCGCTKTGTAANPVATVTTSWWDDECTCHKSTMIPITTLPAMNNYTTPAAPPVPSPTEAATTPASKSSPAATFKGEATRFGGSMFGMAALMAAAAFF